MSWIEVFLPMLIWDCISQAKKMWLWVGKFNENSWTRWGEICCMLRHMNNIILNSYAWPWELFFPLKHVFRVCLLILFIKEHWQEWSKTKSLQNVLKNLWIITWDVRKLEENNRAEHRGQRGCYLHCIGFSRTLLYWSSGLVLYQDANI